MIYSVSGATHSLGLAQAFLYILFSFFSSCLAVTVQKRLSLDFHTNDASLTLLTSLAGESSVKTQKKYTFN